MIKYLLMILFCWFGLLYAEFSFAEGQSVVDLVAPEKDDLNKKNKKERPLKAEVNAQPRNSVSETGPVVAPLPMTEKQRKLLNIGEIDVGSWVGGGLLGTYIGFGLGHAIQGRYSYDGWILTTGEGLGALAFALGISSCDKLIGHSSWECSNSGNTLVAAGITAFVGFRIYEIFDVWFSPWRINKKVRRLKKAYPRYIPSFYILPNKQATMVAGLSWSF